MSPADGRTPPAEERYLRVSRCHRPVMAATGEIVVTSDLDGHPRPYRVTAGAMETLGRFQDRASAVAATPGGLLVTHDSGGDERWQLSLVGPGGAIRPLTRDRAAMHLSPVLSPDGRRVGIAHNPGGRRDFALSVLDLGTSAIDTWLEPDGMWTWSAWSPEGGRAAVSEALTATSQRAFLLTPGGELTRVLPEAGRAEVVAWLEGDRLLVLTDLGSEFVGLAEVAARDPAVPVRWVVEPEADVSAAVVAPDGGRAAVVVNCGFYDSLRIVDLGTGAAEPVETPGPGVVHTDNVTGAGSQLVWQAGSLLVAWETSVEPSRVLRLGTSSDHPVVVAAAGEPPPSVMPVAVEYSSFDGLTIPALHYRRGGDTGPAVVLFHGGPEGQARGNYQFAIQYLLARGIDVLAPNVRGSDGYGVRYLGLDDRERRWDSVRDGSAAGRFLLESGAATVIGAMGGSYGGYMTVGVLVDAPDLWAAGVDIVGVVDLVTFIRNTSPWRRDLRAREYGDPDRGDDEWMARISPARRAAEIRAPLLVLHGRNDVRVPLSQAEEMVAACGAELHVYDDEGHGLVRHENRVDGYRRAADFLLSHLAP